MKIETEYSFGDIVYLKTDKDQYQRIVTGILITPIGIRYRVTCAEYEYYCFAIEISKEKDILMTSTN